MDLECRKMDNFKITITVSEQKLPSEIEAQLLKNNIHIEKIQYFLENALLTTDSRDWSKTLNNLKYIREHANQIQQRIDDLEDIISGYQKYLSEKESPVQENVSTVESKE